MKIWNRPDHIAEIYGTLIAFGLILYFLIMYVVGLTHVIELRLFNFIIMLAGIYLALKQYRRTHTGRLNYFRAFLLGNVTASMATFIFGIFLFFVLKADQGLLQSIRQSEPLGIEINPFVATAAVLIEGGLSGLLCTFLLTNYMVTDQVNEPIDIQKAHKSQG